MPLVRILVLVVSDLPSNTFEKTELQTLVPSCQVLLMPSRFGGVMVSMLAIGPKVRGFKPGRDDGFLTITIRSTPFFGGQVKALAPCLKILRHVKGHFEAWTNIFRRPNS
jgi:hypothetical protein